jgi:hypothetical protein
LIGLLGVLIDELFVIWALRLRACLLAAILYTLLDWLWFVRGSKVVLCCCYECLKSLHLCYIFLNWFTFFMNSVILPLTIFQPQKMDSEIAIASWTLSSLHFRPDLSCFLITQVRNHITFKKSIE